MPTLDGVPFAEARGTRRIPATPGLMRSVSLTRAPADVRVTARPSGIGAFTTGNVNNTSTAPRVRYPDGPRSRSGAFHSLPSTVRYGATRKANASPLRREPSGPLKRGWPGRN